MSTTHSTAEFPAPERIPFLGPFGPLIVTATAGEARRAHLYTDTQTGREVLMEVFERCIPLCCLGLMTTDDRALGRWLSVLGYDAPDGETAMLPAWAYIDDRPLTGIIRVLQMPLWERLDCFTAAMWEAGLKYE